MSTITSMSHNLPAIGSSFVGRERDLLELGALLESCRLVTVTGPAGVGKTRLAVEAATRAVGRYADGVWMSELAAARQADEVATAVAAALSVGSDSATSLDALACVVGSRRLLLVLDNCEHLVRPCAELADRLVGQCPGVSVLATSQEALAVTGERVWRVEPLSVPDGEAVARGDLEGYAAVELFVDRARGQRSSFVLTADDAPAVAEICRRLDGIPVAIELAAARMGMFAASEIAERLDDRFGLLRGGSARTVLPRHQTLWAALDWSHDLLSVGEQVLLRRLAVFADGCTLEAATQVCASDAVASEAVGELLEGLVRRSVVVADTGEPSRYRLLDTTRAYGQQRLVDAGEREALEATHVRWCVALVERAQAELACGDQRGWLQRVEAELDNLRAALSRTIDHGDGDLGRRLAGGLVLYWSMRGRFQEGLQWLERACTLDGGSPRQQGVVLWGIALLARAVSDVPTAKNRATQCLDLARQAGDSSLEARALNVLGAAGVSACDGSKMTMDLLEESLALAVEHDDTWCEVATLVSLGFGHLIRGETAAAGDRFRRCQSVSERDENTASEGHRVHALIGLGRVEMARGRPAAAEGLLDEAATSAFALGILSAAANALRFLGEAASARGDYDTARRRFDDSLALARRMAARGPAALALSALGRLALAQGDTEAAGRVLEDARSLGVTQGAGTGSACALTGLGAVERAVGDPTDARDRLDEALHAARLADDHEAAARALQELGRVAHADGDNKRAASLLHEALTLHRERGDKPAVAGCLESLAGVEVEEGRLVAGARLLAAAEQVREKGGYQRPPVEQPEFDADVALVRRALGAEAFQNAWAEGASVPLQHAVNYAARGRGKRMSAGTGWTALSRRERDVVLLAAQGLTNREIAGRMLVSARTVQAHLANAFPKLGVTSRKQLGEVAAREGALG